MISASIDDQADLAKKHVDAKAWHKTHHVWVDEDSIKRFRINGVPTTYVIDARGIIVSSGAKRGIPEEVNALLHPDSHPKKHKR